MLGLRSSASTNGAGTRTLAPRGLVASTTMSVNTNRGAVVSATDNVVVVFERLPLRSRAEQRTTTDWPNDSKMPCGGNLGEHVSATGPSTRSTAVGVKKTLTGLNDVASMV